MIPHAKETEQSDEALMLAYSKGSRESFDELFGRYKQAVYAYFRRRVREREQAEELTQETFLAIVRAAGRYEPRALFRTYVYAIAFKILRAHRRKAAFRGLITGAGSAIREPGAKDSTEANYLVRHAVSKLDATEREILLLREFEQLSYVEISDVLGIPLNTVRSRLFRARVALKERLEGAAEEKIEGLEPSHEPNR